SLHVEIHETVSAQLRGRCIPTMRRCGRRLAWLPCRLGPSTDSDDALACGAFDRRRQDRGTLPVDTLAPARIAELESGIETAYAWRRLVLSLVLSTIGGVGLWSAVVVLAA